MKNLHLVQATIVAILILNVTALVAQGVKKGRGHRDWEYDANVGQSPTYDANGHVKKYKGFAHNSSNPSENGASSIFENSKATRAPKKANQVDDAFAQVANRSRANGAVSPTSNRYVAPRPTNFNSQTGLAQTNYERKRVDPAPKTENVYANNGLVKGKVTVSVGENKVTGSKSSGNAGSTPKPKSKPASTIDSPRF
jgi:hypothetical protein